MEITHFLAVRVQLGNCVLLMLVTCMCHQKILNGLLLKESGRKSSLWLNYWSSITFIQLVLLWDFNVFIGNNDGNTESHPE